VEYTNNEEEKMKTICLVVLTTVVAGVFLTTDKSAFADYQDILLTGFEDYVVGDLNEQHGWVSGSGNSVVTDPSDVHSGTKGVHVQNTFQKDFSDEGMSLWNDGDDYFSFWFKIDTLFMDETITLVTVSNLMITSIKFMNNENKDIKALGGYGYDYWEDTGLDWTTGSWMHVVVVLNPANYTVHINSGSYTTLQGYATGDHTFGNNPITGFKNGGGLVGPDGGAIDDIYMGTGAPSAPEPCTMLMFSLGIAGLGRRYIRFKRKTICLKN
jgi:hypothetical protein